MATNFVFKISARYKLMMRRRRGTVYLVVKRYTIAMMVMLMLMTKIKDHNDFGVDNARFVVEILNKINYRPNGAFFFPRNVVRYLV